MCQVLHGTRPGTPFLWDLQSWGLQCHSVAKLTIHGQLHFEVDAEGETFPDYTVNNMGSASAWDNLQLRDESPEATDPSPHPASHEGPPIPVNLLQMALVLDSILAQSPPEDANAITALRSKLSSGTTSDSRDLDYGELGQLAAYLAILSTELARRASPSQAHEIIVPDESDSGL